MSDHFNDFYEVLGLPPDASLKDIKTRFRKLSLIYHPDKADAEHENMFELISLAYSVLSDQNKRREYDQMYYIQKRVSHGHDQLKKGFKEDSFSTAELKETHEREVEERHRELLSTYRERTLEEYTRQREAELEEYTRQRDADDPQQKAGSSCCAVTTRFDKPTALAPKSLECFQDLNRIGEMYSNEEPSLEQYDETLERPGDDELIASIEEQKSLPSEIRIKKYSDETTALYGLDASEYRVDGDLILDKIILP